MKTKTIIGISLTLFVIFALVAYAKEVTISEVVNIDNEVADYIEEVHLNNTNTTLEEFMVQNGVIGTNQIALGTFKVIAENRFLEIIGTNNLTKIQLLIDEMENILE